MCEHSINALKIGMDGSNERCAKIIDLQNMKNI